MVKSKNKIGWLASPPDHWKNPEQIILKYLYSFFSKLCFYWDRTTQEVGRRQIFLLKTLQNILKFGQMFYVFCRQYWMC